MLKKIISGGQTGVDRAALDVAILKKIEHGGYCPKGRMAEDGVIEDKYQLIPTESEDVSFRTKKNIEESDGTLVFLSKPLSEINDGTKLTIDYAKSLSKPLLIVCLDKCEGVESRFYNWLLQNNISVLNIGGPRASSEVGIYGKVYNKFNFMIDFVLKNERCGELPNNSVSYSEIISTDNPYSKLL